MKKIGIFFPSIFKDNKMFDKKSIKNHILTARMCPECYTMKVNGTHRRYFKDLICFVDFVLKNSHFLPLSLLSHLA